MLLNIYTNLKSRVGFKDSERSAVVAKINDAAQEIWDSTDLKESLDEFIADINVSAQVISLPWFVENIKKMRYYNGRIPIELHDIRNRYNNDDGNELWIKRWRQKRRTPINQTLTNYTRLTFTIPLAETVDIKVSLQGKTTNSSKSYEEVTIAAGQLSAMSVYDYIEPENIVKGAGNKYDITVTSGDGEVLSIIPNHLLYAKYNIVQFLDQESSVLPQSYSAVEVLYKKPFEPLVNDYDEFCYGNKYDMAVLWKYLEQNTNSITDAKAAQIKCTSILNQIMATEMANVTTKVNFAENPFYRLPYGHSTN